MRKILTFVIFYHALFLNAQEIFFPFQDEPSAFYFVNDSNLFDDPEIILFYDADSLWQTGKPQKNFFSESWSQPNALQTDTINPYKADANASFKLKFIPNTMMNLFVAWNQKVDVGAGDTCLVEFSIDEQQWYSLKDFYSYINTISFLYFPTYAETDLTTHQSQVFETYDKEIFYTDTTKDWMQCSVWLTYILPVKNYEKIFTDSLFIRFRFVSDENTNQQEGWMIDNMYVGEYMIGGGIAENYHENNITVFPNPTTDYLKIKSYFPLKFPVSCSIFDMHGRKVIENISEITKIDTRNLNNGLYYLQIEDSSGLIQSAKFYKSK